VGDDSRLMLPLGEDGSVRQGVVMVKQPGLFSPKFGAASSHVLTHPPQNFAVEPGIHSLAYWDRCFALPQLLYRWRHQSGIFYIPEVTLRKKEIPHKLAWVRIRVSSMTGRPPTGEHMPNPCHRQLPSNRMAIKKIALHCFDSIVISIPERVLKIKLR
jgi:hypothetical protein